MKRRPWKLLRSGSLVFATAALVLPASAAAGVRVGAVDTSGYPEIGATIVTYHAKGKPHVWENGKSAAGQQLVNLARSKSVALVVDRSKSMTGKPLTNAAAAARAFVRAKSDADRVSVIAFGHRAVAMTRFTASDVDAGAALRDMSADTQEGTALYDAVVLAAQRFAKERRPGHVIIVMTDGHDVSSDASLEDAIAAAHRAHAAVYPIAVAGPDFKPESLRRLADESGGTYHQTGRSAKLSAVYAAIARELSRTWQVRFVTAARPGDQVAVKVTVPGAGTVERSVELGSGSGSSAADAPSGVIPSAAYESRLGTLVVAAIVGALVLLACGVFFAARGGSRLRSRLEPHLGTPSANRKARGRASSAQLRQRFVTYVEATFGNLRQFRRLQRLIERADLPLRAPELLAIGAGLGLLLGFFGFVLGGGVLLALFLFGLGVALPIGHVGLKARSRVTTFENGLPDMLITMAASLKAGHSFRQGIQSLTEEGDGPAAKEFRRVLTETQLGRPMDDALGNMAERVGSNDFTFVITAVTIQRQIGGSLAGLFDLVAETVRQRQQFARKVRGLTAMGRMSAYTLMALPFLIALVVTVINPSYMAPLVNTSTGRHLLFAGLVMMGLGSLILKKIVSFRG
jgi:tight adherence protein B